MADQNVWYRIPPTPRVILPAVAAAFTVGGLFFHLVRNKKIFGGSIPRTLTPEWEDATDLKMHAWPREASEHPVAINPIRRENFYVRTDNRYEEHEIRRSIGKKAEKL
ncbi:hypothetical protein KFL_002630040 [Klebsormidium nitens]|uniref:Uncharacterized protein n=1 Tax=Klebsormidium nitens TaxID=105231 RepID=A0A1Y1I4U2_KLENI|nr:hypothetical protein KFL_002630040 [Klebsormidium nitens]|eukprot:GAQ85960.1 hypothetical protein KFL_002630040 [Klebsormidium nitens]